MKAQEMTEKQYCTVHFAVSKGLKTKGRGKEVAYRKRSVSLASLRREGRRKQGGKSKKG
jgi:hypothetical protein